jgi:hypothetical protein
LGDLFRIGRSGELEPIPSSPFADETNDLEEFVKRHPHLFGDLEILESQVRGASGNKIIDILALDTKGAGQVVVMELKNISVEKEVLTQALDYAVFLKHHPDYLRSRAEKWIRDHPDSPLKAKNVELSPRAMIIGPEISQDAVLIASEISIPFSFVTLNRYKLGEETYCVTEYIEPEESKIPAITARVDWTWEGYIEQMERPKEQVEIAKSVAERLDALILERRWELNAKFNKGYVAYKHGSRIVLWLDLTYYAKDVRLGAYLDREPSRQDLDSVTGKYENRWSPDGEFWYVRITSTDFDPTSIADLLSKSYQFIVG